MSASVIEQILARCRQVILDAATDVGTNVFRGRHEALQDDEIPAVNLARGSTEEESFGSNASLVRVEFDAVHHVALADETSDEWETAADLLHMQVHAALMADAQIARMGRGFRCTGTDSSGDSGDRVIGQLTAHYQLKVVVRTGDMTVAVT